MTEPDGAIERLTAQLNHLMSLESVGVMVKTTDLAAVLARAARVAELEAALAKANEPEWFFGNAGLPHFSLYEAVKAHVDPTGGLLIGAQTHLVKVDTARPCKTIWALARFHEPSGEWRVLPCATEAEARALLKEPDQ